jgi:hypothetical protein
MKTVLGRPRAKGGKHDLRPDEPKSSASLTDLVERAEHPLSWPRKGRARPLSDAEPRRCDVHHPPQLSPEISELYETIMRALDGTLTPTEAAEKLGISTVQ